MMSRIEEQCYSSPNWKLDDDHQPKPILPEKTKRKSRRSSYEANAAREIETEVETVIIRVQCCPRNQN
ncbi:hypothetical protein [Evansella cellulosilytica]|uniref:hypothetical protein n=1 Tax=Evansella cellulosilytica TaxID=1413 RepID=UPI0012F6960E|nr:hypothetical protein [Evansella cellulosilytica]